MTRSLSMVATCAGFAVAGCGSSSDSSATNASDPAPRTATAAANSSTRASAAATGALVKLSSSRYGKILVDGRGHTLYLFTHDLRNRSRCYGACARAWPVLYTRGTPRAGKGVRQSLLGTTRRTNGRRQVTYRGHPLYFYVDETRAGQILCQNVLEFGGYWRIVAPSGTGIH